MGAVVVAPVVVAAVVSKVVVVAAVVVVIVLHAKVSADSSLVGVLENFAVLANTRFNPIPECLILSLAPIRLAPDCDCQTACAVGARQTVVESLAKTSLDPYQILDRSLTDPCQIVLAVFFFGG